jgi:mRNA interferase RelE/StbE
MTQEHLLHIPEHLVSLIRNLHPLIKADIRNALRLLTQNPHGGKALKEELDGLRSYRLKKYRIIYRIAVTPPKTLEIIAIGPRKNIYEETFKIISRERDNKGKLGQIYFPKPGAE